MYERENIWCYISPAWFVSFDIIIIIIIINMNKTTTHDDGLLATKPFFLIIQYFGLGPSSVVVLFILAMTWLQWSLRTLRKIIIIIIIIIIITSYDTRASHGLSTLRIF